MARANDEWGFMPTGERPISGVTYACFECGELTTGRHHVVPVFQGGTKQIPLCATHHELVHGGKRIFFPEMIKAGLAKAKARGVKLGPKVKITEKKKQRVLQLRKGGMKISDIASKTRISIGSVHKIIHNHCAT